MVGWVRGPPCSIVAPIPGGIPCADNLGQKRDPPVCRSPPTSRRNCEYRDDAWARRPTAVKTMRVTGRARIEGAYMTYVRFRMGGIHSCIAACSFRARNDSQLGHTSRLAGARLLARRPSGIGARVLRAAQVGHPVRVWSFSDQLVSFQGCSKE